VLVIGQVLMIVGLLGLCTTGSGTALWSVTSWLLPIGAGAGLVAPAMTTMMLDGVPADRGGFGAGLLNAIRQLGSGAAPAVFGLLLTGSALTGLRTSLLIAAVVVVFSSALAFTRSERPSQRESPDS
jgi:DHA2 family methylenomycin A resistance protein-like MFS transporter